MTQTTIAPPGSPRTFIQASPPRAGEENRTPIDCLEGSSSAIELHPHNHYRRRGFVPTHPLPLHFLHFSVTVHRRPVLRSRFGTSIDPRPPQFGQVF